MSFLKFKRHIKKNDGYHLTSEWTSSQTVEMDNGNTLEEEIAELKESSCVNTNSIDISWEDYEALGDEKLTNNVTYYIPDGEGGGSDGAGNMRYVNDPDDENFDWVQVRDADGNWINEHRAYTQRRAIYMTSANEGGFEIFQNTGELGTLTLGEEMVLADTKGGSAKTKIYSDLLDMSRFKTLHFDFTASTGNGNAYTWIMFYIDKARIETGVTATLPSNSVTDNSIVTEILLPVSTASNAGEVTIDLSAIEGEYYISVLIHSNSGGVTTQVSISDFYME